MVIIVSDQSDKTTQIVSSYLQKMDSDFIILTDNSSPDVSIENFIDKNIKLANGVWLRRGNIPLNNMQENSLNEERITFQDYLHFKLEKHPNSIGSLRKEYYHNKLIDLELASHVGLQIPLTTIFNNKVQLKSLFQENPNVEFITKSMKNPIRSKEGNCIVNYGYTIEVIPDFNSMPDEFAPSLVQEKIEKLIEIRAFFLCGNCYSMAIFSQSDEQTKLDYRYYNTNTPNRNVPYSLPEEIEIKIRELMDRIGLNCGSIDLILTPSHEYVFLEVNPVGQFSGLSEKCNYSLEKIIANYLNNTHEIEN